MQFHDILRPLSEWKWMFDTRIANANKISCDDTITADEKEKILCNLNADFQQELCNFYKMLKHHPNEIEWRNCWADYIRKGSEMPQ